MWPPRYDRRKLKTENRNSKSENRTRNSILEPRDRFSNFDLRVSPPSRVLGTGLNQASAANSPITTHWESFMVKPNGRLVRVSCTHYCASTSRLSNRWSSCGLLTPRLLGGLGDLILGRVSRLYAFSGYPNRTSLPSDAPGGTARSQEVRPPRSSRTKGRPPQISYAHTR